MNASASPQSSSKSGEEALRRAVFLLSPRPAPYLCIVSYEVKLHILHGVYIFPFHLRKRHVQVRAGEMMDLASFQKPAEKWC